MKKLSLIINSLFFVALASLIGCVPTQTPVPPSEKVPGNSYIPSDSKSAIKVVSLQTVSETNTGNEKTEIIQSDLINSTNGSVEKDDKLVSDEIQEELKRLLIIEEPSKTDTESSIADDSDSQAEKDRNFRMLLSGGKENSDSTALTSDENTVVPLSDKASANDSNTDQNQVDQELSSTDDSSKLLLIKNLKSSGSFRKSELKPVPRLKIAEVKESSEEVIKNAEFPPIQIYTNRNVDSFIKLYTKTKRKLFLRGLKRGAEYLPMIYKMLKEENMPAGLAYLAMVESNFNPRAVSRASAKGMWQFMRATGRQYGLSQSWWHDERYDPEKATRSAIKLMKDLYKRFGDWELALASYNSGLGNVRKAIRRNKAKGKPIDFWSLKLPRETRGYVPAFLAVNIIYNNLEKYGFTEPEMEPWVSKKVTLKVPGSVSLKDVAKKINISYKELKQLNPALRYYMTPANTSTYNIWIPKNVTVENKTALFDYLKTAKVDGWLKHRIKRGDTLWDIARKYDIRISDILTYNPKIRHKYLRLGKYILIPAGGVDKNKKIVTAKASKSKTVASAKKSRKKVKAARSGKKYVVKKGDTLIKIAKLFGTTVSSIIRSNDQLRSRRQILKIGMRLAIK